MNIYDFDNTIFKGDSTAKFYLYCLKKHPKILSTAPRLFAAFARFYIFKRGDKTEFKENMYSFLKFCDIEKDVNDFWELEIKNIKTWYIKNKHQDDIIISASPEFLLSVPCKMLGIKHLIASRVDSRTGKYTGKNCHGKEKVARLFAEYPQDIDIENFYSDSYSDTPLARLAKNSYLVKDNTLIRWDFSKA